MDSLNEIIEFIVDPDEDGPMAEPLEVAPAPADFLLCGQQPDVPVGEAHHVPFPDVHILASVNLHCFRNRLFDRVPLRFQIVPEDEMRLRIRINNFFRLRYPYVDAVPFLPRCVLQAKRRIPDQLSLAIFVKTRRARVAVQPVVPDVELRQPVSRVVIAQIGRVLNAQRPARHPQPEFVYLVRIQRQVICLLAVPLEKPRHRLPRVHHVQISGIVNQLFVFVR